LLFFFDHVDQHHISGEQWGSVMLYLSSNDGMDPADLRARSTVDDDAMARLGSERGVGLDDDERPMVERIATSSAAIDFDLKMSSMNSLPPNEIQLDSIRFDLMSKRFFTRSSRFLCFC
jgi:hypothetical protein